jgi:hypothetical protein
VDAIVRFYQAEWLARLHCRAAWAPLFRGGHTPVANPGSAALAESKRLPLVFEDLKASMTTWRQLLPETRAPEDAPFWRDEGWLVHRRPSGINACVRRFDGAWVRSSRSS